MCPGGIFGFLARLIVSLSFLHPIGAAADGCVAVPAAPCMYVATYAGGYQAAGDWSIEITRAGSTRTYHGHVGGVQVTNVIQPGDHVSASVGGDGFVRVGSNVFDELMP